MDSEPGSDYDFEEVERLEKAQRHLQAFPPDEEATWALFRNIGGLCRACLGLLAPPGSGWATTPGSGTEMILSYQAVRNAQASGPKGCPLCRAVYQAAEQSHSLHIPDVRAVEIRILSPSRMDLRELEWNQRFAAISLRRGEIYLDKGTSLGCYFLNEPAFHSFF